MKKDILCLWLRYSFLASNDITLLVRKLSMTCQCLEERRYSRFGFRQFFATSHVTDVTSYIINFLNGGYFVKEKCI